MALREYLGSASRVAVLAAASIVASETKVLAADLGGNCCADLEERVAELEATTARKGNRKVSLQVYGVVSEAVIWWNDGAESNAYVLENNRIKNKIGFIGEAKIDSDWSAGFQFELQINAYRSSSASQLSLGASENIQIATFNTASANLRFANWYLDSKNHGRLTVGRSLDAAANIALINLARPDGFSSMDGPAYLIQSYRLRRSGTTGNAGLSSMTWATAAYIRHRSSLAAFDYANTFNGVKYTSPFFLGQTRSSGFRLDAGWGMDDMWSVGLRYAETLGAFRFAAGVGYSDWRNADRGMCSLGSVGNDPVAGANPIVGGGPGNDAGSNTACTAIQVGASLMHTPTGLYITAGGGQSDDHKSQAAFQQRSGLLGLANRPGNDPKSGSWYVQAGWEASLSTLGKTTFWGQYVAHNVGLGVFGSLVQTLAANDTINSLGETALLGGSNAGAWSLGITQNIDAADMALYLGYQRASTEISLISQSPRATRTRAMSNPIDDFQALYTGATIRF